MQNSPEYVANLPLVQNQGYVLPTNVQPTEPSEPTRRRCRCKCRKWCKNHRRVLKVCLIVHMVFAGLGVLLVTPIVTILRFVSSIIGLRSLKKKDPVLLVAFCGMSIYDILLTVCAPFLGTLHMNLLGGGGHHGDRHGGRGAIWWGYIALILIHGVSVLFLQVVMLVKGIKFYRSEKSRHSGQGSQSEDDEEVVVQAAEVPHIVERKVVHENAPIAYDSSMIVSLPPPPQQVPIVQEAVQVPVVQPGQEQYVQELRLLREMGFGDERKNLELLRKEKGNIQRVIQTFIV